MIKNHIIYNNFSDYQFGISKAEGSYIWDDNNRKIIDFTSGWNVTNLGWNHPEITNAIIKQAKKNTYAPMWTADPIQEEYALALCSALPKGLNSIGRATGGTEANEEAIKTARAYTGRNKIIGFKDTYHGQSFATFALGYLPAYTVSKAIGPLLSGFIQIDFPKTKYDTKKDQEILLKFSKELEAILEKKDIAAIVCEAGIITGWGSTYVAPCGFLSLIRSLTKKYGTLLIVDEVGTGFSRVGKLFGIELENVTPDIVTFAKGVVNGALAIGVMVTKEEIAEKIISKANLVSTFGWTPVACAAALKTLEIHQKEKIWEKAKKDGEYILSNFKKELNHNSNIEEINGIGMEIGVKLLKKENEKSRMRILIALARKKGLHLAFADDYNFQIMPPLTIEKDTLDKGIEIFLDIINSY